MPSCMDGGPWGARGKTTGPLFGSRTPVRSHVSIDGSEIRSSINHPSYQHSSELHHENEPRDSDATATEDECRGVDPTNEQPAGHGG